MKPLVYIAGPYRAGLPILVEYNIRAAELYAIDLARAGIPFLCPHTMTRFMDGAADDAYWLAMTLELMERCDWVLVVGDFKASQGTKGEIERADDLGKPVYFDSESCIRDWKEATS